MELSDNQKLLALISSIDAEEKMLKLLKWMKDNDVAPEYVSTAARRLMIIRAAEKGK